MRATPGKATRRRHNKVLEATKGYRMTKHRLYKVAHEAYIHAGQYAYQHRQRRQSQIRTVWIQRISAACALNNTNYSRFMANLKKANIEINKKVLADLAYNTPSVFTKLTQSFSV